MVASIRYRRLKMSKVAPALFLALGVVGAALIAVAPAALLDTAIERLGIATLLPAGVIGRALLALVGGGAVAFIGLLPWLASSKFARRRATRLGLAPPVRRADAHPDAPARRPIAAHSELGAPLPALGEDDERPLPADLDLPLAAFDPDSLVNAQGERFETFPLPSAAEVAGGQTESIATLLERLERGASRRAEARTRGRRLGGLRNLAAH